MTLAEQNDLIVTLPTRAALLKRDNPRVVLREPPLDIPAGAENGMEPAVAAQPGQQMAAQAHRGYRPGTGRQGAYFVRTRAVAVAPDIHDQNADDKNDKLAKLRSLPRL